MPTRKIGKTQLYKLNLGKEEVKVLVKAFDLSLKAIENELEKEAAKKVEKAVIR